MLYHYLVEGKSTSPAQTSSTRFDHTPYFVSFNGKVHPSTAPMVNGLYSYGKDTTTASSGYYVSGIRYAIMLNTGTDLYVKDTANSSGFYSSGPFTFTRALHKPSVFGGYPQTTVSGSDVLTTFPFASTSTSRSIYHATSAASTTTANGWHKTNDWAATASVLSGTVYVTVLTPASNFTITVPTGIPGYSSFGAVCEVEWINDDTFVMWNMNGSYLYFFKFNTSTGITYEQTYTSPYTFVSGNLASRAMLSPANNELLLHHGSSSVTHPQFSYFSYNPSTSVVTDETSSLQGNINNYTRSIISNGNSHIHKISNRTNKYLIITNMKNSSSPSAPHEIYYYDSALRSISMLSDVTLPIDATEFVRFYIDNLDIIVTMNNVSGNSNLYLKYYRNILANY